ncbi:MAG: hypothetical protein ACJ72N_20490 [Labedaea sp.]
MRRLVVLLIMLASVFVLAPAVAHAEQRYTESFESGLGGWVPASDDRLPSWSVTRSPERPFDGTWGLRYDLNGQQDDGTVWVQRRFPVAPNLTVTVEVSFWVWSDGVAIGGWPVVAYAGALDPKTESDFTRVGTLNRWVGWKEFRHKVQVQTGKTVAPTVTVGFGLTVDWEVVRADYFDLVTVTIA